MFQAKKKQDEKLRKENQEKIILEQQACEERKIKVSLELYIRFKALNKNKHIILLNLIIYILNGVLFYNIF